MLDSSLLMSASQLWFGNFDFIALFSLFSYTAVLDLICPGLLRKSYHLMIHPGGKTRLHFGHVVSRNVLEGCRIGVQ